MSAQGEAMARSLGIIERWATSQGILSGPIAAEIVELWAVREEYEAALDDLASMVMDTNDLMDDNKEDAQ